MNRNLIGIVAEKGAGKSLFVKIAKEIYKNRKIASVKFSDPLRRMLGELNKEITRESMQNLATFLRENFKDEGVLNSALKKFMDDTDAEIIFLDGVRKQKEAEFVKEQGGRLVYITADQKIRFERRKNDPENEDEKNMDWEKFLQQESAASETSIRDVGEKMGEAKIENNGTVEEFEEKIKKYLEPIIK